MNAHQLDANGVIINTIVVDDLDVFPDLVDAAIGGKIGDQIRDGQVVITTSRIVPQVVSRRQGLQALRLAGITESMIEAEIMSHMPDGMNRDLTLIELHTAAEFERSRDLVQSLGFLLGLNDAQIDDLFIQAAEL